jgi:excisionase family DNA binding protein
MPQQSQSSDLLTIAEASTALRLQPSTLRSWILKRKIAHVKLGSRVFIRRSDIDALISRSVVPANEGKGCGAYVLAGTESGVTQ